MPYLTVVPAYGRDYKSMKAALADWAAGKDFRISDVSSRDDGRYISVREAPAGVTINIRYASLRRVAVVQPAKPTTAPGTDNA